MSGSIDRGIIRKFEEIEEKLGRGEITLAEALKQMKRLKEEYIEKIKADKPHIRDPEQSWHSFIGNKFQELVFKTLKGYVQQLKRRHPEFQNLYVLSEREVKKNEYLVRKLAVRYGEYLLLPDTDIVIAICDSEYPWNSKILAIVSCKTSLRERIAQACYWKLKLLQSDVTKHIKVYLVTTDNDDDFSIGKRKRESYNGKSRNRIIAEYELDGIYIMRDDFKDEWESNKVKKYEKLLEDLVKLIQEGDC
ncbi:MAG TPA: hypothetical protein EYH09_02330 [Candidatus Nanopusillus sp.]|nr:hypothetical protein [Candidatus Nanopusillus sp.]